MGTATNFTFNVRIDRQAYKPKKCKSSSKGRGLRHVTYLYNFGDPLSISGTDKSRKFKFGVRIDRQAYKRKNTKVGQKERSLRHVTYFYNFGTPLYLWNG